MWAEILALAGQRLKPSTAMLLTGSTLIKCEDDVLTVEFPATAKPQKEMCENNGRLDQITAVANEYLGRSVRIKFVVAAATVVAETAPAEGRSESTSRRREILNDPAVKAVLTGLEATVTGIEDESAQ